MLMLILVTVCQLRQKLIHCRTKFFLAPLQLRSYWWCVVLEQLMPLTHASMIHMNVVLYHQVPSLQLQTPRQSRYADFAIAKLQCNAVIVTMHSYDKIVHWPAFAWPERLKTVWHTLMLYWQHVMMATAHSRQFHIEWHILCWWALQWERLNPQPGCKSKAGQ